MWRFAVIKARKVNYLVVVLATNKVNATQNVRVTSKERFAPVKGSALSWQLKKSEKRPHTLSAFISYMVRSSPSVRASCASFKEESENAATLCTIRSCAR